jgi:hypothetical protein
MNEATTKIEDQPLKEAPQEEQPKPKRKRSKLGRRNAKQCTGHLTPETAKIWSQGKSAWAAYMRECKKKLPRHLGTRWGVPNGMRRAEADKLWAEAREKADWLMEQLQAHGILTFD